MNTAVREPMRIHTRLGPSAPLAPVVRQVVLALNPASADVQRDLQDVQRMHARTCSLVGAARADARLLWRADGHLLVVQSTRPIDLSQLPRGYASLREERTVKLDWPAGTTVRWEIVANPTRDIPRTRRRVGLTDPEECADWIQARLPRAGLRPLRIDGWQEPLGRGWHPMGRIIVGRWRFRGVAIVEQPDALAQALVNGIGKGRAYGVGLLTVEEVDS